MVVLNRECEQPMMIATPIIMREVMVHKKSRPQLQQRTKHRNISNEKYKVQAKCPFCGTYHFITVSKQPVFMPREYCPLHLRLQEEE